MHEVLVNHLGGLSLPRKSVVRLTDRPDMTLDVYRGRKTTIQQQQPIEKGSKIEKVRFASLECVPVYLNELIKELTLLHSERPKLYTILAFLSAIG